MRSSSSSSSSPSSSRPPSPSSSTSKSLTVACRLVTTDQWLITHLSVHKPISSIKQLLLTRFFSAPPKSQNSPPSPITFAPAYAVHSRRSFDRQSRIVSLYDDDTDDIDTLITGSSGASDAHTDSPIDSKEGKHLLRDRMSATDVTSKITRERPFIAVPAHTSFLLLTFSTGIILEDHFTLEWYNINNHELLELHPTFPGPVRLDRTGLKVYAQPYFHNKVCALRGQQASHAEILHEKGKEDTSGRRYRTKKCGLEWRTRWVTVDNGHIYLSKNPNSPLASKTITIPLMSLIAIRGAEHLPPDTPPLPRSAGLSHPPRTRPPLPLRSHTISPSRVPLGNTSSAVTSDSDSPSVLSKEKDREKGKEKAREKGRPPSQWIVCAKFHLPPPSTDDRHHHSRRGNNTSSSYDGNPSLLSSYKDTTPGSSVRMSPSASDSRKPSLFDLGVSANWGSNVVSSSSVFAPHNAHSTYSSAAAPLLGPTNTAVASTASSSGTSWWRRGSRDVSGSMSISSPATTLEPTSIAAGLSEGGSTAHPGSGVSGGASEFLPDIFGLGEMFGMRRGSSSGIPDAVRTGGEEQAAWIELDMGSEHAQSNLLRILHLHGPPSISSSFLTPVASPTSPTLPLSPLQSSSAHVGARSTSSIWTDGNYTFPPSANTVYEERKESEDGSKSAKTSSMYSAARNSTEKLLSQKENTADKSSSHVSRRTTPPALSPTSPVSPAPSLAYSISSLASTKTASSSRTLVPHQTLTPTTVAPQSPTSTFAYQYQRAAMRQPGLVISTGTISTTTRPSLDLHIPSGGRNAEPATPGSLRHSHAPDDRSYSDTHFCPEGGHHHDESKKKLRYPDRRWAVVRRARRAGVGKLGRAMEGVLFGLDERTVRRVGRRLARVRADSRWELDNLDKGEREQAEEYEGDDGGRESTDESQSESNSDGLGEDSENESDASWREWEGWTDDVRVRARELTRTSRLSRASPGWTPFPDDDDGDDDDVAHDDVLYSDFASTDADWYETASENEGPQSLGWASTRNTSASQELRPRTLERLPRRSWISERSGEYIIDAQAPSPARFLTPSSPSTPELEPELLMSPIIPSHPVIPAVSQSVAAARVTSTHQRSLSTYASADSLLRRSLTPHSPSAVQSLSSSTASPSIHAPTPRRRRSEQLQSEHGHALTSVRSRSPLCAEASRADDRTTDEKDTDLHPPERTSLRGSRESSREATGRSRFSLESLGSRRSSSFRRERPHSMLSELEHFG